MSGKDWIEAASQRTKAVKRPVNQVEVDWKSKLPDGKGGNNRTVKRAAQNTTGQLASELGVGRGLVENPHSASKSLQVVEVARRDPIADLEGKRELNDAQVRAAGIVKRAVERLGMSIGTVDPSRIRVDCAGAGDPEEIMLEAGRTLRRVREVLGRDQANIIIRAAGYGVSTMVIACDCVVAAEQAANGAADRGTKSYVVRTIQLGLTALAVEFGLVKLSYRQRDYLAELLGD